jgi:hypothetical protein
MVELVGREDLDVTLHLPPELHRIASQGLVDLTPWHLMDRAHAKQRLAGMRTRYRTKYVPFARRQDNDDVACLDPAMPGQIVLVHDFADEGWERRATYGTFWDWFRAAVEDMILFE